MTAPLHRCEACSRYSRTVYHGKAACPRANSFEIRPLDIRSSGFIMSDALTYQMIVEMYRSLAASFGDTRVVPEEAPPGETWDEWLDRSQKRAAKNREWRA